MDPTGSGLIRRAARPNLPSFHTRSRSAFRIFCCSAPVRSGVRRMDYFWYLFRFDGRINRARYWQALLMVIGIGVFWIMFFGLLTMGAAGMLGATGPINFSLGIEEIQKLFDPAFYRT